MVFMRGYISKAGLVGGAGEFSGTLSPPHNGLETPQLENSTILWKDSKACDKHLLHFQSHRKASYCITDTS